MTSKIGKIGWIASALLLFAASQSTAAAWQPAAWASEDTLELRTQAPGEEPYWFPVWLVVIDDQVYVRLGSRAADRVEANTTKPILGVRIAGAEFPSVKGVPAPESAEKVNAMMADKYWSDLGIRLLPHPLTLRLEPAAASAGSEG
jgi:hypothetical protein